MAEIQESRQRVKFYQTGTLTVGNRLLDEAASPYGGFLLLPCGPRRPVQDPDRDPLSPFLCLFEGAHPVGSVISVFFADPVDSAVVPLKRIDAIEGDAGLEDIDEGEPLVTEPFLD